MADSTEAIKAQIATLRSQGKTESTSKKLGGLVSKLKSTGGGEGGMTGNVGSTSGGQTGGFEQTVQRALDMTRQAYQPAVSSLQAGMPEISQRFETQKQQLQAEVEPLQQRYQRLLDQIKGSEQQSVQRESIAQANELGRRGILPSSGLYEQTVSKALQPINEQFGGLTADVGFQQEAGLRNLQNLISNLPLQQTEAQRAVQNAVAQLQAGGGQNAIQTALGLLGQQQSAEQFGHTYGLQQQQADLARRVFEETTRPESQANIQKLLASLSIGGKTNIGVGAGSWE